MSVLALLTTSVPLKRMPVKSLRIAPTGSGRQDGADWDNAAPLSAINTIIGQAAASGSEVWIRADAGSYSQNTSRTISNGGTAAAPVVIRGVDKSGNDMYATLVGTRMVDTSGTRLWNAKADTANGLYGNEVFRLNSGANNLEWAYLNFVNQGRGCFRIREPLSNLTIRDCTATNVAAFTVNDAASNAVGATISKLRMYRCVARGYSKFFAAIKWDSNDILIEDCIGDSERQDGDNFASGIIFDGTAHGIICRRCTMNNHIDTMHRYQNGDGIAGERTNYDILLEYCITNNNTDGGIDFKSERLIIRNHHAEGNHRNYRLWGDAELIDSVGIEPIDNAGANPYAKANIGVFEGCMVRVRGGTYTQTGTFPPIRCEKGSMLSLSTTTVFNKPANTPVYYTEGAVGDIQAAQFQMMPVNDTTPAVITSTNVLTIDENKAGQWLFTFNKFAQLRIAPGLDAKQFGLTGQKLDMYKQDYDPPANTTQLKVNVYSIDGSGNRSGTVLVTININNVDDDPISPEQLKAFGVTKGAWIEVAPQYCWQDLAGTIPAGVGDPVARVDDRFGFGTHLLLEGDNDAAILATSGLYYYLDMDGNAGPYTMGGAGYMNFPDGMMVIMQRRDSVDDLTRYMFTVPRSLSASTSSNFRWGMSVIGGASFSIKIAATTVAGSTDSYTSAGTGATVGVNAVLSMVSKTAIGRSKGQNVIDGADRSPMTYPVNGIARFGATPTGTSKMFARFYGGIWANISPNPTISAENAILFRCERQMSVLAGVNL